MIIPNNITSSNGSTSCGSGSGDKYRGKGIVNFGFNLDEKLPIMTSTMMMPSINTISISTKSGSSLPPPDEIMMVSIENVNIDDDVMVDGGGGIGGGGGGGNDGGDGGGDYSATSTITTLMMNDSILEGRSSSPCFSSASSSVSASTSASSTSSGVSSSSDNMDNDRYDDGQDGTKLKKQKKRNMNVATDSAITGDANVDAEILQKNGFDVVVRDDYDAYQVEEGNGGGGAVGGCNGIYDDDIGGGGGGGGSGDGKELNKMQQQINITMNETNNNNSKKDKNNDDDNKRNNDDDDDYDDDDDDHHKSGFDRERAFSGNSIHSAYIEQTSWAVLRQMAPSFIIAGFGSVFAGIVLNMVTQWPVFDTIPQFEVMVPAFIGLIGNIETTLASRLSTHANLRRLDHWDSKMTQILMANMLVVQCQASTVGLFAALMSLIISTILGSTRSAINWHTVLLLCSSSVLTSVIANTLLALLIGTVIIVSRRFRINPDNISTPVAASMGDVCSLLILAYIAQFLYDFHSYALELTIILVLICIAPVFGYFARQNRFSKSVIITGWSAILLAVIVEQPGGVVMQNAFAQFDVMSTFQPLVNGIASNLVGIQTSRMSTFLHSVSKKGELPPSNPRYCVGPFWVFLSSDVHARMARLLMLVIVPAHLFYMTIIYFLQNTFPFALFVTAPFIISYIIAIVIQLTILLYLAYVSVFWAWKKRINPDNSAIPFTSALADLLGNCLMAAAFMFLKSINDANANVNEDDAFPIKGLFGGNFTDGNVTNITATITANITTTIATIITGGGGGNV